MTSPADLLVFRVRRRMAVDRAVRAALTLLPWLAGIWLLLVLLSRLLNLFPDPVRLHALWIVLLAAAAAAPALHRRPTAPDAARRTDQALGTRDLFLTVSRLDGAPGEFKGIVESQAAEAAAAGKPAVIAPYAWRRPAGIAAGSLAALALAILLVPQLDPFKKGEERAKNEQQKKELAALRKNTDAKKKELAQKPREEVSKTTKDSLDRLRQSFQQMKPKQKEKNDEKLKEEQRDIGKQWQQQSEDLLKKSERPEDGMQSFGRTTPRMKEWKKDLADGRTQSMQRDLDEMKKLADKARDGKSEEEKKKAAQELRERIKEMSEFAKNEGANANLAATLSQALSEMNLSEQAGLANAAMEQLKESLDVAGMQAEDLAQSMRDLKSLEKAMSAIQKARQANKASEDGLDGEKCEGDMTMEEYAQLYDEIMKQCQGDMAGNGQGQGQGQGGGDGQGDMGNGSGKGMGGPGHGRGGKAETDPDQVTKFAPEKSDSAFGQGKVLLKWQTDEAAEKGEMAGNRNTSVQQTRQAVSEAIVREQVPPGYHGPIQKYFDSLAAENPPEKNEK
ncbi:MAG: hypothetical protein U1F77_01740 [Kiritimatiellia bacterium]